MNSRDEEVHPADRKGKRIISGGNRELPTSILKAPGSSNAQRPPFSSIQTHPADDLFKLPVAIDSFGAVNIPSTDEFGVVQEWYDNRSSSFGSTYSRRSENANELTGSFNILADNEKIFEAAVGKYHHAESGSYFISESGWGKNLLDCSVSAATSNPCSSRVFDAPWHSNATTYTCTLDERTSNYNDYDSESLPGGPSFKRLCPSSRYDAEEKGIVTKRVHFESPEPTFAEGTASHASSGDELLPSTGLKQTFDARVVSALPIPHISYSFDETRLQSAGLSSTIRNPPRPRPFRSPIPTQLLDLKGSPKPSIGEDLRNSDNSMELEDGLVRETGSNYKFASIGRQTYLRQRMEERQRIQDATAVTTGLPEIPGAERCRHVISPEDLVWLNIRDYCGMLLDPETGAVLGTAVLFIPSSDCENRKSAWVTSVNTVEGRWEVVIKDSRGKSQVAKLMLTSIAFGLAFFSVRTLQNTFGLAFLNMVIGPASLPHRTSVDAEREDRVYVFGYEEPWESEAGGISDIRVRPGKIIESGNMEIVEIDFTRGRLGGSIRTPSGFSGGLVARADGVWAGIITGQTMPGHPSRIDFCSAYSVYSFLEEL